MPHSETTWLQKVAVSYNPVGIFLLSAILGWIFIMIPNVNYFVYELVKSQYWSLWSEVVFIEILDTCLPETSDQIYLWSYLLCFIAPMFIHVVGWASGIENNFYLSIFWGTSQIFISVILYGIDAFRGSMHSEIFYMRSDINEVQQSSFRDSATSLSSRKEFNKKLKSYKLFDLFVASTDIASLFRDSDVATSDSSSSSAKSKWISSLNYNHTFISTSDVSFPSILPLYEPSFKAQGAPEQSTINHFADSTNDGKSFTVKNLEITSAANNSIDSPVASLNSSFDKYLYLPRYIFKRNNVPKGFTLGNRRVIWLMTFLFILVLNISFGFLIYITQTFRAYASSDQDTLVVMLVIYIAVTTALRVIMKRIGLDLDCNKCSSVSMFFLGELVSVFYYFTFYRVLFESIRSWGIFCALECMHLASEWVLYPFRISDYFYQAVSAAISSQFCLLRSIGLFINANELSIDDWRHFIVLDFGIRVSISLVSGIEIILYLLCINYIPWITISLQQDQADLMRTLLFVFASLIVEGLNALAMHYLSFAPKRLSVTSCVMQCFKSTRFAFLSVAIGTCLFINPMYALTYDNNFDD